MERNIKNAFISVFYKSGLEPIIQQLAALGITIYSTGGTHDFIEAQGVSCVKVEHITGYPGILGGRVKTLHPKVFGGILARRNNADDMQEVSHYDIPLFDLVIVDLYPFEETVASTTDESLIIEKIDIGGVSLIRAAAKNFNDVCVVASRKMYPDLLNLLTDHGGATTLTDRKKMAATAFAECAHYDVMISAYFKSHTSDNSFQMSHNKQTVLRYGENPHQSATYNGDLTHLLEQLNGKDLSYNNLTDVDAAMQLIAELNKPAFAIIKHTNVCGVAERDSITEAWQAALSGDPESAFGGVLITNQNVTLAAAELINPLFFEVLIAPGFNNDALALLSTKKNRILLRQKGTFEHEREYKRIFNGVLVQDADKGNYAQWNEVGARECTVAEKSDLLFANIVAKHLKSNAIALVKNGQLIGKGCGQTSRIDALRQAIEKARSNGFSLEGAAMASDAFFPFSDCVQMAHEAGVTAVIQPGGSIRDADSINYSKENGMAMVITGVRHFRH